MENVVLASANQGKVPKLAERLADVEFKVIAQTELAVDPEEETSLIFIENATLKARHAAQEIGLSAIEDDYGVALNALGGTLGIYSACYARDDASDRQNLNKLLAALKDLLQGSCRAQFYCVLIYMRHEQDPTPLACYCSWVGEISIGTLCKGGGYDPVFYLLELSRTATELSGEEKACLLHRSKALKLILAAMRNA